MAIIYSYPIGTPSAADNLLGTQVDPITEENKTVQFGIGAVSTLITQGYLETTTTITNAQWTALGGTPVTLVPNPGANKYVKVLEASIFFDFAVSNFSFTNLEIAPLGGNVQATLLAAGASPVDADQVWSLAPTTASVIPGALTFRNSTAANPTGGGTVQVKIRYQVLDTSAF